MRALKRLLGMFFILFGMTLDGYAVYAVFSVDCGCGCCEEVTLDTAPIRPALLTYSMSLAANPSMCAIIGCTGGVRPVYIDALAGGTALIGMGTLLRRRGKIFAPTPMRIAH